MDHLLNTNYITGLEVCHEKLPAGYYTQSIPALRSLDILDFNSPVTLLTALLMISRLAADSSQFFIATHSPILLALPDAHILSFDGGEIHPITYEETECYQVMEMFINHRAALLDKLFSDAL